ncbi:MAG TPA: pseudouridine synthase [Candidatus Ozemobacteraceae bacterium]|nr:pseudouridine synthase [Candidatus Ozemobacteraceae bacterium]
MPRLLLFNKPFNVLCQFTGEGTKKTLADFIDVPKVYAAGRLDYDSEGLLLLTDVGFLNHLITDPEHKLPKTYLVQVEGTPTDDAISKLCNGVLLKDGMTRPAQARVLTAEPPLWPRQPPIRERRHIPTTWLELTISEGRNRQVRRMTAAVGLPTLRLVRTTIGPWRLDDLPPGTWRDSPCPRTPTEYSTFVR